MESSLSIVAVCHVFFNRYPISLESICTYNDLASISRHYYSVLYRNSVLEMFFYVFWVYKSLSFVKLILPTWEMFLWENISRELTFGNCASKIVNFMKGISWIQIRNLISQKTFLRFKINLAIILTSTKCYVE